MSLPKYNCSQNTLYAALHEGADRLGENITDFGTVFPEINLEMVKGIKSRIEAADALPDHDARKFLAETLWTEVDKQRKENTYLFGLFLCTIDRCFESSLIAATYDAVGRKYYLDAKAGDEDKVIPMFSSLNPFIADNWAVLSTTGKMTTVQRDDFMTRQTKYKTSHEAMKAADRAVKDRKAEKIDANNACYDEMLSYLKLAQRVYGDNPTMAKVFTFTALKAEVEGVKNAGLSGKITNVLNKEALKGATITIKDYNKSAVTDKLGRFEITPLSMDKYTVIVECPGFVTQIFKDVKIRTGVTTRLNVKMVAVAEA